MTPAGAGGQLKVDSHLKRHAGFVRRHHVLDVDKGVLATALLEELKCLADELAEALLLALRVVDHIASVQVLILEEVEDRENLSVVRNCVRGSET